MDIQLYKYVQLKSKTLVIQFVIISIPNTHRRISHVKHLIICKGLWNLVEHVRMGYRNVLEKYHFPVRRPLAVNL